ATLHHAGLGHWVARSPEEYVMLASQLVYSPDTRRMLRQTLRATLEDTVCNGPRFTQELERVYRHLWKSYCDQVGLTEETQS
ncbi:MAG: hypothetical protein KDA60_16125, partial [Planctomycetales bacterium]|nr:hypothetical protein [Planctomycetales bacterium]